MTKRKDVIKALECCKDINKLNCDDCPYSYNARSDRCECTAEMASDALELLKEQEPKEPTQEAQREYEATSDMRDYCERYEPTYNPDDGSM